MFSGAPFTVALLWSSHMGKWDSKDLDVDPGITCLGNGGDKPGVRGYWPFCEHIGGYLQMIMLSLE